MKNKTPSGFCFAMLVAVVVLGCSTPNARRAPVDQTGFTDIGSRLNNRTNWIDGPVREF
jgi:hypothetical protein